MKKFTTKLTNSLERANWKRVKLTSRPNNTTNYAIPRAMFDRECAEYDGGTLQEEHDLYLGERYA